MKKIFLLFVMAGCFTAANAQVKFGGKAGLNISDASGEDAEGGKAKAGFHIGALAELPIAGKFSVQPELVFSMQGAKDDDVKMNLNYLNLPILAKYTFIKGLSVQSGPQVGFLLSAKAKADGGKHDMKEYFKKVDVSWVFAASYVTPIKLGVDLRYNAGLTKMAKGTYDRVYNSVLQLGVFYMFGGDK